ncbi:MAG: hypothetical protein AAB426_03540 [Myxococcota bacterium]
MAVADVQAAGPLCIDEAIRELAKGNAIAMLLVLSTLPADAYKWVKTEVYGR